MVSESLSTNTDKDPLWDPTLPSDALVQALEQTLKPLRVKPNLPKEFIRSVQPMRPRQLASKRVVRWLSLAAGLSILALFLGHQYRLSWPTSKAWTSVFSDASGQASHIALLPGEHVRTATAQFSELRVARIGSIKVAQNSELQLLETSAGQHRVKLNYGQMRAKIWAPPGYFAVTLDDVDIIDLGCEFELWKHPDGERGLQVQSGWVEARVHGQEILVPSGHRLSINAQTATTPVRMGASTKWLAQLQILDALLASKNIDSDAINLSAQKLTALSSEADRYSLLSLLTRFPALADSAIYPRLAGYLGQSDQGNHRSAWRAGDQRAINAWWAKLPNQPKQWWRHWADAW
jgi:hypothetical protein